jgi:uncharacterized protein DUF6364
MNITLSADEKLIARARAYAQAHNTTLTQMVREYMERLTGQVSAEEAAKEFRTTALSHPGRSPEGFRFDREAIHERGGES